MMYSHGPALRAPVDSGARPDVWFSSCLTVILAFRGSLSGWAQGMNWNGRVVEGHPAGRAALLTLLRRNSQDHGADGLGA
jgi:hypothetical protein